MGPIRLLDLGEVSPLRSQALYHGLAEAMGADTPDTIVLCRPAAPYFCVGYHQIPGAELDLDWCREHGYPVLQRRIGGGTVFLDSQQLFYQCVFHRSRAPFDVASIYRRFLAAPVQVLGWLGLDAHLTGVNEIEVGTRRIAGTGGGQIGEAVVVTGNILFDFDYDAMARAWRVPSEAFRRLAADGLRRYVTTLKRELPRPPSVEKVKRLLAETYGATLGRPVRVGTLTSSEELGVSRAEAELAHAGWPLRVAQRRNRRIKIARGVYVRGEPLQTPTGIIKFAVRVRDGTIEELLLDGDDAAQAQLLPASVALKPSRMPMETSTETQTS